MHRNYHGRAGAALFKGFRITPAGELINGGIWIEAFSFGFHQSDMRTAQILGKRTSVEKSWAEGRGTSGYSIISLLGNMQYDKTRPMFRMLRNIGRVF